MESPPQIGTQVELLRYSTGRHGYSERAVIVEHLSDPFIGDALVLQLEGETKQMQRLWPSPTIRLAS